MAKAFSGASVIEPTPGAPSPPDYRSFLLISTVLWTYIQSQLYLGFALRSEMRRGTAEAVLITPASRFAYLTGNAAYQFLRSTIDVTATVALGAACFGVSEFLGGPNWPRTLAILALDLMVVYGYGLVLAGLLVVSAPASSVTCGTAYCPCWPEARSPSQFSLPGCAASAWPSR